MVYTDGMPAAAQRKLLTQLRQAGARLLYNGDFDWPVLHIGDAAMRNFGAEAVAARLLRDPEPEKS